MRGSWMDTNILACPIPKTPKDWEDLHGLGVTILFNFTETKHPIDILKKYQIQEYHFPVKNFCPPTPNQLKEVVQLLTQLQKEGKIIACHCMGGRGRTGTFISCFYVKTKGIDANSAIKLAREKREKSVETKGQIQAVNQFYLEK